MLLNLLHINFLYTQICYASNAYFMNVGSYSRYHLSCPKIMVMSSISVPLIGRPTTCRLSSEVSTPSFCISKDLFNQDDVILYVKHESTFMHT